MIWAFRIFSLFFTWFLLSYVSIKIYKKSTNFTNGIAILVLMGLLLILTNNIFIFFGIIISAITYIAFYFKERTT